MKSRIYYIGCVSVNLSQLRCVREHIVVFFNVQWKKYHPSYRVKLVEVCINKFPHRVITVTVFISNTVIKCYIIIPVVKEDIVNWVKFVSISIDVRRNEWDDNQRYKTLWVYNAFTGKEVRLKKNWWLLFLNYICPCTIDKLWISLVSPIFIIQ